MEPFPFLEIAPTAAITPSRLLPLSPREVGTPMQESLPSYLNRLAAAHSLPVPTFLSHEILPVTPERGHILVSNCLRHYSRLLLVGGGLASKVADRVSDSTGLGFISALV